MSWREPASFKVRMLSRERFHSVFWKHKSWEELAHQEVGRCGGMMALDPEGGPEATLEHGLKAGT